ncbi:plasmid mobilization protein [Hydrocarboniphaga effusa]|jgi:hypothetical protein|uniref:plasmid mobilization protein n=1 Tax=Hydrocarboniphaga effusa TaxID=243629 RepID=UPI0031383CCB
MSIAPQPIINLTLAFNQVAAKPTRERRRKPAPFSIRLSSEEKARLRKEAKDRPLGEFIRARVLGESGQRRRALRCPVADDQKLAAVLAELGRSRLSSNLNQLAKAANTGTLDISPDLTRAFEEACRDIRSMREMLMVALGHKPEGRP